MKRSSESRNGAHPATVVRLIAVLDAFVTGEPDFGVTELAGHLGLAKSVVHRLVTALADADYLAHDPVSRRYRLGPKAIRLGLVALSQAQLPQRARPVLRALAAETGETATMSILDGDLRVYIDQVESSQPIRQTVQLGQHAPLYLGASGKAILAFLPAERRDRIVCDAVRRRATYIGGAPVEEERLLRELHEIRRQGFAVSESERILGAASVAAPVFDHHGQVIGSISVASVTVRHDRADLLRLGPTVRSHAERLSQDLGWLGLQEGTQEAAATAS